MKLSAAAAVSCAVVVVATTIGEGWAGGRSGGRGASHSGHKSHPHGRRTTVVVGSSFYYGPAWWYPAPYYVSQPVYVAPQPPTLYIQQGDDPEAMTWYYCESARAYYPYAGECPEGWQPVVPDLTPQTPSG